MNSQKLLSLLFLFSTQVKAFEIKKVKDELFISGKDCKKIESVVLDLAQWKKNMGEAGECSAFVNLKSDSKVCNFNISNCVPAHVLKYQDARPEIVGPNCWNLALVMKGILPSLRNSTPEEMTFFTKPPLCNEINKNQRPSAGDLGAIRVINKFGDFREEHGFIYISDAVVYTKNGIDNEKPYQLQPTSVMDSEYTLGVLKNVPACTDKKNRSCKITKHFKCDSVQDYFKKQVKLPKNFIEPAFSALDVVENRLQRELFSKGGGENKITKHLTQVVNVLVKLLES